MQRLRQTTAGRFWGPEAGRGTADKEGGQPEKCPCGEPSGAHAETCAGRDLSGAWPLPPFPDTVIRRLAQEIEDKILAPKIAVVVPTNRPERIAAWWEAWREQLAGCRVIIVEDAPEVSAELGILACVTPFGAGLDAVAWNHIDADLGPDSWIIPRRTDCIRSYGFLLAYRAGADIIMTMDDDCLPVEGAGDWARRHAMALGPDEQHAWEMSCGIPTRGLPYESTSRTITTVLNHGLWNGVPDFDAPQTLATMRAGQHPATVEQGLSLAGRRIPPGRYFPMCGMNLAFRREIAPTMYFLLMGECVRMTREDGSLTSVNMSTHGSLLSPLHFDRFGDIWAGIIAKRICDHLGYAVRSGSPHVLHERASDPFANLRKEAAGIQENETFWQRIDAIRLKGTDASECYLEVAAAVSEWDGEHAAYWRTLGESMRTWVRLMNPPASPGVT